MVDETGRPICFQSSKRKLAMLALTRLRSLKLSNECECRFCRLGEAAKAFKGSLRVVALVGSRFVPLVTAGGGTITRCILCGWKDIEHITF